MVGQRELTLEDYVSMLRRRWPLMAALALIGGALSYGVAHFLPKRYLSQTLVLVTQPTVPGDYVKPVINIDTNQRLATMQQEILSRTRLEPVIKKFGLYGPDASQLPMEDLVARLRGAISVTPVLPMAQTRAQGLPGFNVSVTFEDPRLAQQICATITSMFMEQNLQLRQQMAEQTTQFLAKQLEDAKVKLDDQDTRLAAFKRHYLGSLPDQEQANLNVLLGLTAQLDATTQALTRAQQDKTFTESTLAEQLGAWRAAQQGRNPVTFEQQLAALQEQLSGLRSKYTAGHPDVIKVNSDIEVLKKKMAEADQQKATGDDKAGPAPVEPAAVKGLRAQLHQFDQMIQERAAKQEEIQRQIKIYQARVQSSPAVEQEYKKLTRDFQTALEFYNDLLKKGNQSAMASDLERRQQGEQFRVLDAANLPDKPWFPNQTLFGLGGLGGGLALGIGLAFLMELQDTSLRTEKDVESLLTLPVLATVPRIKPLLKKAEARSLRAPARV